MSATRRVNLYRPLLEGGKRRARQARAGIALGLLFAGVMAGVFSARQAQAQRVLAQAEQAQALIELEQERQRALARAALEPEDASLREMSRAWEEKARVKEAFVAHPERFSPAHLRDWEGMFAALEQARLREPEARLERFEAVASPIGAEPSVALEGFAPTQEAALAFARAATDSRALSHLPLGQALFSPAEGAGGKGWSFVLKAGSQK